MASIVYQTDKRSGSVYAYQVDSVRNPETNKCEPKRTYLGRVDPISHEIISKAPAGKRNRSGLSQKYLDSVDKDIQDKMDSMEKEIEYLRIELEKVTADRKRDSQVFDSIVDLIHQRQNS
jgi:hypothetical protein